LGGDRSINAGDTMMLNRIMDGFLSRPRVFEWQQRLCNNYSAIGKEFHSFLDVRDKDILDIGCSTGNCARTIISMENNRYVGIDISREYVELARQRHPQGNFQEMDARRLAFRDHNFDIILFIASLHHMDDEVIRDCTKEIRRVIRKDGVVLCAEPVFAKSRLISTFVLHLDRGRHIRSEEAYRSLFDDFVVCRASQFDFSIHRFCSFVLRPREYVSPNLVGRKDRVEIDVFGS
jgi:SAM-dependent methyltransferase